MSHPNPCVEPRPVRWRPHASASADATARARKPRAAAFHPVFGNIPLPRRNGDSAYSVADADRAVAGALAANPDDPDAIRREAMTVRKPALKPLRDVAKGVLPSMQKGAWQHVVVIAGMLGYVHTLRTLLRIFGSDGVTKRDLSATAVTDGDQGSTFLTLAASTGNPAVVATLLEAGANPNATGNRSLSPLQTALKHDNADIVKLFVQCRNLRTTGALFAAARYRAIECLPILLRAGVPVDELDELGNTALCVLLIEAADCDADKLQQCAPTLLRFAELLLDAGAAPDVGSKITPLATAARMGLGDLVELLLERGASIVVRDRTGHKVDALVAALRQPHAHIVRQLLKAGASLNEMSYALEVASREPSGEVAAAIFEHMGTAPAERLAESMEVLRVSAGDFLARAIGQTKWSPATLRRVLEPCRHRFPIDAHAKDGTTALQRAVKLGQIPLVLALLDCAADPTATARDGKTTAMSISAAKLAGASEGSVERRLAEAVHAQLVRAVERQAEETPPATA